MKGTTHKLNAMRQAFASVALALVVLSSCVQTPAPTSGTSGAPAKGGSLTVGIYTQFGTLDPATIFTIADREAAYTMLETLFDFDAQRNIKGLLVEKWDQPDATTYVFHLRKGVKFHDGTDLDANAVKVNLDRILDPATKSYYQSDLRAVKSVDVVDSGTVRVTLSQPFPALLAALSINGLAGVMVSPAALAKYGKDIGRHPVGTGPFQFVEWIPGDHITVKRFDGYWQQGFPYLDQVVFKEIPDDTSRLNAMRTGAIDVMSAVAPKDFKVISEQKGVTTVQVPGYRIEQIFFNVTKPPFNKRELRQAVELAMDKDAILKNVYSSIGTVGQSVALEPASWAFDGTLKKNYPRDANAARKKLADGGAPNGFEFTIINSFPDLGTGMEILQANLKEIGVSMKIESVDTPTLVNRAFGGEYQATTWWWAIFPDPAVDLDTVFTPKGTNNFTGYGSPQVSSVLESASRTADVTERKKLYAQVQSLIADDVPGIAMRYGPDIRSFAAKVKDLAPRPDATVLYTTVWLAR